MYLDFYVYILLDSSKPGVWNYGSFSFDYEPFYVGKGKSNRIKDTFYDKSPFKKKKIDKLKSNGIEIITKKLFESLSNEEAIKYEIDLISIIGRRDFNKGPLVNLTDGGDGRLNSKHSEEVKAKISRSRKGKSIGWKHSRHSIEKMSQKQTGERNGFWGKKHTDIVKDAHSERVSGISHPMYGKKHSEETKKKLVEHRRNNISNQKIKEACQRFNKPVLMFDLQFNFISEFISVKEASALTGINESVISKCCRGLVKTPTRFYFKYKNIVDKIKNNKFVININDSFVKDGREWRLVKRNKKTCVCESDGEMLTLHVRDNAFLFEKEKIK